eukprot:363999-Chlamydomonas_euryale.AAC.5
MHLTCDAFPPRRCQAETLCNSHVSLVRAGYERARWLEWGERGGMRLGGWKWEHLAGACSWALLDPLDHQAGACSWALPSQLDQVHESLWYGYGAVLSSRLSAIPCKKI